MVHVEVDGKVDARARLAGKLADRFRSQLIGITAWMPRPRPLIDPDSADKEVSYLSGVSRKQSEKFKSKVGIEGKRVELRSYREFPTDCIVREMRSADLLVIARDFGVNDPYLYPDTGAVILKGGRPVLTVPPGIDELAARHIVVGWKDTREARRALYDARPFLRNAERVILTEICEQKSEVEDSQRRLRDVAKYLSHQGVSSVAERVFPMEGTVLSSLLHVVEDGSSDLLVVGAYGHNRFGEWIFGGLTQELMAHSPVCCLLSH